MLLKLSPEATRLRRLAKAFAAGECSQADYRALRREIIDGYSRPATGDDTERRVPRRDQTTRTLATALLPLSKLEPELEMGSQAKFEPGSEAGSLTLGADDQPRSRWAFDRRWFGLAVLALLVVALGLLPGRLRAVESEVPPVRERAADPANSRRVAVTDLQLVTDEDVPEPVLRVARAALAASLAEVQARQVPTNGGFTEQELRQVAQLLEAFGVHDPDGVVSADEAAALSASIQEQKRARGLSVRDLEEVAAGVQLAVREEGLLLAVATVPAQTVRDGQAQIALLPGRLGNVNVTGAPLAGTTELVARQFQDLRGLVLTRGDFETRLGRLGQVPGLSTQLRLEPGTDIGAADLNVELFTASPYRFGIGLDNHGFDDVGSERATAWFRASNALGRGEELDLGVREALLGGDQRQFWAGYRQPWLATGTRVGIRYARNDFDAADLPTRVLGGASAKGSTDELTLDARQLLYQTRRTSAALALTLGRHQLRYDDFDDQALNFVDVAVTGQRVFDQLLVAMSGTLGIEAGYVDHAVRPGQSERYLRLHGSGRLWRPINFTGREQPDKLVLRWRGQWADTDLPPTRALALGQAQFERGFEPYQLLADRALSLALEWRRPLWRGEALLFTDVAYGGSANSTDAGYAWLSSAGAGWDVAWNKHFSSRLSIGMPLNDGGSPDPDSSGLQIFWKLGYAY